jgi:CubicO group peptidase (beta-lactamase class C family)
MRRREFLGRSGCLALSLIASRSSVTGPQSQNKLLTSLQAGFEREIPVWMRETAVPGVGVAVVADARVAWRHGFGLTDAAAKKPVTTETMFEAASVSKPVFAYVVMKLCESGLLDLDTPLTKYTSERFLPNDRRLDLITARHVLAHTAGFQNWRSESSALAISFTPGERHQYSGEGYNYLQRVVTGLLRRNFDDYMSDRLFNPLGMSSSGYVWNDEFARRMARPHDKAGQPSNNKMSSAADVARYGSAGALLTTPGDLATFMAAVIAPAPADSHRLSASTVAAMLRPQVKIEGGTYPASWALGWQIFKNGERDFLYHGGDNDGFHCFVVGSVAGRSALVVMTNGEGGTGLLSKALMAPYTQAFLTA